MEEAKLYFHVSKDDSKFLDDMKGYFKENLSISEVRYFSDPVTLIALGISAVALTLQAIDFICERIHNDDSKVDERHPICIVDPTGRINLIDHSSEETKDIVLAIIEAQKNAKQ